MSEYKPPVTIPDTVVEKYLNDGLASRDFFGEAFKVNPHGLVSYITHAPPGFFFVTNKRGKDSND